MAAGNFENVVKSEFITIDDANARMEKIYEDYSACNTFQSEFKYAKNVKGPGIALIIPSALTLIEKTYNNVILEGSINKKLHNEALKHAVYMSEDLIKAIEEYQKTFSTEIDKRYTNYKGEKIRSRVYDSANEVEVLSNIRQAEYDLKNKIAHTFQEHQKQVLIAEELSPLAKWFNAVTSFLGWGNVFEDTKTELGKLISDDVEQVTSHLTQSASRR